MKKQRIQISDSANTYHYNHVQSTDFAALTTYNYGTVGLATGTPNNCENVWCGTATQYAAIVSKDPQTLYFIIP
jgi:hypothetical protein